MSLKTLKNKKIEYLVSYVFKRNKSAKCYTVTQTYTPLPSIDFKIVMASFSTF